MKPPKKSLSLMMLVVTLMIALQWINIVARSSHRPKSDHPPQAAALMTSADIDSSWRYTEDGWQDSAMWESGVAYVPDRIFESVHPLVWAALIVFAVTIMMIWTSNEWQVDRLVNDEE